MPKPQSERVSTTLDPQFPDCFTCGKALEPVDPAMPDTPYKGTLFTSHGHYGSTVFDSMSSDYLEVVLCDECLDQRQERVSHCFPTRSRVVVRRNRWKLDDGSRS